MKKTINVLVAFGTRPEAIKMAPLILALKKNKRFDCKVLVTAQHREMLDQVLNIFNIVPDYDLDLMSQQQSLVDLATKILSNTDTIINDLRPDLVLVHGDTLSANYIAQAAFLNKVHVAHIEAGLRTYNLESPWPEEANRQLISRISTWHFSPTLNNKENLIREMIPKDNIAVVGNTVIDSLIYITNKTPHTHESNYDKKQILVTCHRRENLGPNLINICNAIKSLAIERHTDIEIIIPVHKNPLVKNVIDERLKNINNIQLIAPLDYLDFINLMRSSYLILTDSGGIQEEAPSLGVPVLVLRDTTERQEAIEAGTVKLIGTEKSSIIKNVNELLDNYKIYESMSKANNPYGNGDSSKKIIEFLLKKYN